MQRVYYEDALKHLFKLERRGIPPTAQSVAGQLGVGIDQATDLMNSLVDRGLLEIEQGDYRLTREARDYALHIIRAHRLWEQYLADQTGISELEWHSRAEKLEHELTPEQADELSAQLGNPTHDPHGDPVPTAKGTLADLEGRSLLIFEPGQSGRIIHIEDEPNSIYARLMDEGFYPGMEFTVLSRSRERIVLRSEGTDRSLSNVSAANITAEFIRKEEIDFETIRRLSQLKPGSKAEIVRISRASRGTERRRLMDLGVLPGTRVETELKSPSGDPTAYRIRGALIALRREQADRIFIREEKEGAA
jgi:DtxR family Mn-dependent transcriptional regulator